MSAPARTRADQRPDPGARQEREDGAADPVLFLHRSSEGAMDTLRRGLRLSPEFARGLWLTLAFAVVATAGKVIVPVAVQQIIDNGLTGNDGPDLDFVTRMVTVCAALLVVTMVCSYLMNVRLYRATESGLATLRRKAFRHVHDLSVLTQNSERKGALVSRVTSDVDQISTFMQWGGMLLLVSSGQLLVATVLMAVYSWQLTLVVWICFLPLLFGVRWLQRLLSKAYLKVRENTGDMLGVIGETVTGAAVIRAHGIERRTAERIDTTVLTTRRSQIRAQRLSVAVSPFAEIIAAVGNTAVVLIGVWLGLGGDLTAGQLIAFLFLMTLFIQPMMMATEIFNEAQNAIAGWRRVLGVLDTVPDIADPGEAGRELPRGPVRVSFEEVTYSYPEGPVVLDDVSVEVTPGTRLAVVGETGSGKTTFVKLLTRLMDPDEGTVRLDGVDLREVAFSSLRGRVVMVPQEGFLFDSSLGDNIRFARPESTDAELEAAITELGLSDWLDGLAHGLDTPVGQRGESMSAGERQLVALVRAYVADPDLLVLDEATSAVDPHTEVRIQRALDRLTRGRTSVTIAHRLSTAEAADRVLVFDAGRIAQSGSHTELAAQPGVYADLYASWVSSSA
ncbi:MULTISPECIES: ABC transporter ATP-binding protein [Nocardiopsis]|uniref:Multidrug ABC transporter ATP-binding protein n=1 Tax=Nocardiopsis sinuspersici TaxID=501010 RepID=A0A1V3C291_9ACTN|nr:MULTISPECIES: ABC transporter ATP-binding protein [Nocardiopsis]NYH50940.1 putative ABC transport system ATP-binding protein [Nocardiopsis sinuspersici]OOC54752.1 multidrug ABC transporter ATP-binding protein [Nocardiopsis sinuspersici]